MFMHSASVRRTSMREKKAMTLKEAREEGQKLLASANVQVPADDDDDDGKSNAINGPPSTSAVTVRYFHSYVVRVDVGLCGSFQFLTWPLSKTARKSIFITMTRFCLATKAIQRRATVRVRHCHAFKL